MWIATGKWVKTHNNELIDALTPDNARLITTAVTEVRQLERLNNVAIGVLARNGLISELTMELAKKDIDAAGKDD